MKIIRSTGCLLAVALVASPCSAARVIRCSGRSGDLPMTASILSNERYGDIVQATFEAGTTRGTYSAATAPATGRIIFGRDQAYQSSEFPKYAATIPLDSGDRLVLSPDELHVTAFDRTGNLLGTMGCSQ